MTVELIPTRDDEREDFIVNLQAAFQQASGKVFGDDEEVISREDILESFNMAGAQILNIVCAETVVGGAVVVIRPNNHNELLLFYVKTAYIGKGIGYAAWLEIEKFFPATEVWETETPYFEERNIHFYVNKCGFHIVEFYNPHHPSKHTGDEYFFRFEKVVSK